MNFSFKQWLVVVAIKVLVVVVSMIVEILKDSGDEVAAA